MTRVPRPMQFAAALQLLALLPASTASATLTWNGGNGGQWLAGGEGWLSGNTPAPWVENGSAAFSGTAPLAVTIGLSGITVSDVTVAGGNYSFSGPGIITLSSPAWQVAAGITNSVAAALGGTAGLTKSGAGELSFAGNNKTFTGGVAINGGAIRITNTIGGSLGSATNTAVTLNGGALHTEFRTNNTAVNYAVNVGPRGGELRNLGNDNQRFAFVSNTINGAGTLRLSFGTQNTRFVMGTTSQTNFTGRWIIDSGGNVSRFVDVDGTSTFGRATGDDAVTLVNSGSVLFRSTRTYGTNYGITLGGGGGSIATGGGQTVTLAARISGPATNALRLDLGNSASVLVLANTNNSWLGATTLANQGTLRLGASGVIPDQGGTLEVAAGTKFDLNGRSESIGGLSGAGTVDNQAAATSSVLTIGGNDGDAGFSGVLQSTGAGALLQLVKIGAGTQSLSGTNSLAGGLEVRAGTLRILAPGALGSGPVELAGGTLFLQSSGTFVLPALIVRGAATLDLGTRGARLEISELSFEPGARLLVANGGDERIRITGTQPTEEQLRAIRSATQTDFSAVVRPGGTLDFPDQNALPWWDGYSLIVQDAAVARALELGADCVFTTAYADPTWGLYAQKVTASRDTPAQMHAAGLNHLTYYEAFGEATTFAVELAAAPESDGHYPVTRTYWNWHTVAPRGGAFRWAGPQNYFDAEDFCGPFTRLHPVYGAGGRAMTYPDGSPATGYVGDDWSDPRKSRVLDAGGSKNVLGQLTINYAYRDEVAGDAERRAGLLDIGGRPAGHLSIGKDTACPQWIDQQRSSVLHSVGAGGVDGIWADNFSAWDNFGYPPIKVAFGDWSVALFREYLTDNFSPAELSNMGISDPATFDVRAALRTRVVALGGNSADLDHSAWHHPAWLDDPIWRAYKIFKRQTATAALADYYRTTKEAATSAGRPDFAVFGNDIPLFSLGFVRGELDAVSTELTPGWYMGVNSRGFMLPPLGRFTPAYTLGREHTRSRLVNVWMYLDGPFAAYRERPGLVNTLYYEMLANHALPMLHEGNSRMTQDTAINGSFFAFVRSVRGTFGARRPVTDTGLYYSTSSLLADMTPAGFLDMDNQPHGGGFLGWATALGSLQTPFRAFPEWKLAAETLAGLRVLILPDVEVLDASEVALITAWVESGGRLVVTGNTGARAGEKGNFDRYPNLSTGPLTGVQSLATAPPTQSNVLGKGRIFYIRENIGLGYFNASTAAERNAQLPAFRNALSEVLADAAAAVVPDSTIPATIGLNVYEDSGARRFFVDLNNYDVNLETDTVTPTPRITFTVAAPDWLKPAQDADLHVEVLSPGNAPTATVRKDGEGRLRIGIDPILHYASIVITSATHYPAAEPPTLSPSGGVFHTGPISVMIESASPEATLRYTLDGGEPTADSREVVRGSTLQVSNPGAVKVRAWLDNPERASAVTSAQFNLSPFGQWTGGNAAPDSASLGAYATGGVANSSNQPAAPTVASDGNWFSVRSLVRTNDPGLRVFGVTTPDLGTNPSWTTNGVTVSKDPDNGNIPIHHERLIFSIPQTGKGAGFLRLQIELAE